MPSGTDLPDVNVWLALTAEDHQHHHRALHYWQNESQDRVAFTRVTALGFVRLLGNRAVMAGRELDARAAWEAYVAFRRLPEVLLAHEPDECEVYLAGWARGPDARPRLWTDAYLASVARTGGMRLVSFDRDFERFDGLRLLTLR